MQAIPAGEVDEEGYSIRPQDAAEIRGFPDDNPVQDSDDSDFEDGGCGQDDIDIIFPSLSPFPFHRFSESSTPSPDPRPSTKPAQSHCG